MRWLKPLGSIRLRISRRTSPQNLGKIDGKEVPEGPWPPIPKMTKPIINKCTVCGCDGRMLCFRCRDGRCHNCNPFQRSV